MKANTILFIIILILSGCTGKPTNRTISSDILQESSPRHLVLADIVESQYPNIATSLSDIGYDLLITYTALETSEDYIIGQIRHCELIGDSILLSDGSSMYMFNQCGGFVWKVSNQGRGPGEYSGIGNITVDRYRKEIIISCSELFNHYIYDYNGAFIEELDLSPARGFYVKPIDSTRYLVQTGTHHANPWAWVASGKGIVQNTFSEYNNPPKIFDDGRGESFIVMRKIEEFLNGYYLWQSDTVWYLNSMFSEIKAILTIDSRIKEIDAEMFHPVYQKNVRTGGTRKRHYVYDISHQRENLIQLTFFFKHRILLYDLTSGTLYESPAEGYVDDIDNGPPIHGLPDPNSPQISAIYPLDILKLDHESIRKESDLLKIYNTIKREDNPVVRIITQKQSE
jgi:hypothetical protein